MSPGLPELLAGLLVAALTAYVLFAGADFGGGVWDLLAAGPRRDAQRTLIAGAIAPIWEANHVWLIFAIVVLFTCFPPAFAFIAIALHVPLMLMLVGIVLRGAAFMFRSYDDRSDAAQRRWGRLFAIASLVTPVLLGMSVGAVASGRLGPGPGGFVAVYVMPWLTPFTVAVGVLALVLFAFLAAVYLTLEAEDTALREDFRRRALATAIALPVVSFLTLALARQGAPLIYAGLTSATAVPLQLNAALAGGVATWALWKRRYALARLAAGTVTVLIMAGWAFAQYPWLVPPVLDIRSAAAPAVTLRLVAIGVFAGLAILVPSLWYLFRIFKSHAREHA